MLLLFSTFVFYPQHLLTLGKDIKIEEHVIRNLCAIMFKKKKNKKHCPDVLMLLIPFYSHNGFCFIFFPHFKVVIYVKSCFCCFVLFTFCIL